MGMYNTYPNTKCCAACEFWGALRRIYSGRVESEEWRICSNRRSSYYRREKRYRDYCSRYLCWIALDMR